MPNGTNSMAKLAPSSTINNNTLDNRHNQAHTKIINSQAVVEAKERELVVLNDKIIHFVRKGLSNLEDGEFDAYQSLHDRYREVLNHITNANTVDEEVNYMLETAEIVFKYYDIIDNGEESHPTSSSSCTTTVSTNKNNRQVGESSILRYFMCSSGDNAATATATATATTTATATAEKDKNKDKNRDKNKDKNNERVQDDNVPTDRATLLDMYLEKTDPNHFKPPTAENFDKCSVCGNVGKTVMPNDGLCYCNACHAVETLLIDHEKPSYKDPPKEITYFAYKRINHLNEWISQIQGKESTEIPPEIYDKILLEIRKQRITNMADVTNAKIREILKKLGQNRFYEHGAHIMNRLNGMPSISLTPEIEDKLRQMFKMIQIPFFKHAPRNRKNFLSYSYTLHKCLQLLELDEYLKYFPLLKSREKTHAMDEVWKKICADLSWHFYPSV